MEIFKSYFSSKLLNYRAMHFVFVNFILIIGNLLSVSNRLYPFGSLECRLICQSLLSDIQGFSVAKVASIVSCIFQIRSHQNLKKCSCSVLHTYLLRSLDSFSLTVCTESTIKQKHDHQTATG